MVFEVKGHRGHIFILKVTCLYQMRACSDKVVYLFLGPQLINGVIRYWGQELKENRRSGGGEENLSASIKLPERKVGGRKTTRNRHKNTNKFK